MIKIFVGAGAATITKVSTLTKGGTDHINNIIYDFSENNFHKMQCNEQLICKYVW